MSEKIVCSVVVPLYNEEEVLLETYKRLKKVMDSINETYEIIFVNDGSRDKTAQMVYEICNKDNTIKFVDFARNFGRPGSHYCWNGLF